jgi:HTH-type transcriptional regulator/antitoxin HigA
MPNIAARTVSSGRNHATAKRQYTRLLTGFSPVAIESAAEHGRALKAAAAVMDKENRSPAETSLLKLLAVLIEDYEQKRYPMGDASSLDTLKEKRGISKEMARKLGEIFHVSPAVFI